MTSECDKKQELDMHVPLILYCTIMILYFSDIYQINTTYLHIGNVFFSMGDDVITCYISGIQFLPVSPQ